MELNIQLSECNQDLIKLQDNILTFSGYLEEYKDNPETSSIMYRAEVVIQTLINKIEKTQEEFFTNELFKDLASYISNINNALYNYRTYNNTQYIQQIRTNIEHIINAISKLCFDDKETISTSLATIVGNSKQSFTRLKKKVESYEGNIKDYKNEIQKLQDKIEEQQAIINGFSEQFNKNQIERDTLFANKIADFNEKFAENQEKIKSQWFDSNDEIKNEWKEKLSEVEKDREQVVTYWENEAKNQKLNIHNIETNFLNKANEILRQITEKNEEVEKLYGLIGKNISCGNYKKLADDENKKVWCLYVSAFLIMFVMSLLMASCIWQESMEHTVTWINILERIPVAFTLYAPALYLAMEAKKRHNYQMELRDFEIKIESIDPYLKNIDYIETKREAKHQSEDISARRVKLELAKDFFRIKEKQKKNDNILIPKDVIKFAKQLVKIGNFSKNNDESDK